MFTNVCVGRLPCLKWKLLLLLLLVVIVIVPSGVQFRELTVRVISKSDKREAQDRFETTSTITP